MKIRRKVGGMIKKIGIGIIVFLLVLVLIIAVGKNMIAKTAVTTGVKVATGLKMNMDKLDIGIIKTLLSIEGLVLYNPSDFEEKVMVDLPEIYVDYDLGAFFKKKVHLREVRLNLKEFIVVRNKQGVLNLDSLTAVQASKKDEAVKKDEPKAKSAEKMEMQIDLLKLKIGKVIEKDYSAGGEPVIKEYNINIDETFENISDLNDVVKIVLAKILPKISAQLLKNSIAGSIGNTLKESEDLIKGIAGDTLNIGGVTADTVKNTTKKLKNLLPFGK